jgi:hypothetical protein
MLPVSSLRRYIPPLCPDPRPATVEIRDPEDLESIAWIKEWSVIPGFDRFAHGETPGGDPLLVAKYRNGNVAVVGFLDARLPWLG